MGFLDLLRNFFTHKDFLPPASEIPGTMFTPLHFIWSALLIGLIAFLVWRLRHWDERRLRPLFTIIWATLVVLEVVKIVWESTTGKTVGIEWGGILPLYPCSLFMYAMPFAIWGNEHVRRAGCGYVCTLGLIGGSINFIYPATILGNYSCISFAGFHTFLYHGAMVFVAILMLVTGYHSYRGVKKWYQLLLPSVPALCLSVVANIVNFTINSDYMFFRLRSFIFAPIGAAIGNWAVPLMYLVYIIAHALFYLPSYIANKCHKEA